MVGAAGLIGSVFVERLLQESENHVRPLFHTTGNAGRLARLGIDIFPADVLSKESLRVALADCSHVVNCARGPSVSLIKGMKNLIDVCLELRVERLIHLSSVLVYGERPEAASVTEAARPNPSPGYGRAKHTQDQAIVRACRKRGLRAVVLCIPNVTGPNSRYLQGVLGALRKGQMALVDGGKLPVVLVDVENVAAALELALDSQIDDGRRIFINDGERTTWRDLIDELMPLAEGAREPQEIGRAEAERWHDLERSTGLGEGLRASTRLARDILQLDEVRALIKQEELFAASYHRLVAAFPTLATRLKSSPLAQAEPRTDPDADRADSIYVRHQLRNVMHSIDRAREYLGYAPVIDFPTSMERYRSWYRNTHGYGGSMWPLLRELYR